MVGGRSMDADTGAPSATKGSAVKSSYKPPLTISGMQPPVPPPRGPTPPRAPGAGSASGRKGSVSSVTLAVGKGTFQNTVRAQAAADSQASAASEISEPEGHASRPAC